VNHPVFVGKQAFFKFFAAFGTFRFPAPVFFFQFPKFRPGKDYLPPNVLFVMDRQKGILGDLLKIQGQGITFAGLPRTTLVSVPFSYPFPVAGLVPNVPERKVIFSYYIFHF
jgi:hypothetical protein